MPLMKIGGIFCLNEDVKGMMGGTDDGRWKM